MPATRGRASRIGALLGVALVACLVGLRVLVPLDRHLSLAALAVPALAAVAGLGSRRARPFARGFLAAVLVCSTVLLVTSFVMFFVQITTGGP